MSASLPGRGTAALGLRTNRSRAGGACPPASTGFHCVAGATSASRITFLGPTRRSRNGAIARGQLAAAISRSALLIVTCASFSASANVDADTGGPDTGPVPKVGGAPGVDGDAADVDGVDGTAAGCESERQAADAAAKPSGAVIRNCLRVFMSKRILCCRATRAKDQARRQGINSWRRRSTAAAQDEAL